MVGILLRLFGATALAANQIVQSVGGVLYMLPIGVATATSIRIGQAIGAGNLDRRRPIARTALLMVTGWMSLVTLVLILTGGSIANALSQDPDVIATATGMFIVVALIQVADVFSPRHSAPCAVRATSNWPTGVTLASYWLLALPLGALLCFVLDLGPLGLWAGYGLGTVVAANFVALAVLGADPTGETPKPSTFRWVDITMLRWRCLIPEWPLGPHRRRCGDAQREVGVDSSS